MVVYLASLQAHNPCTTETVYANVPVVKWDCDLVSRRRDGETVWCKWVGI